MKPLFFDSHIVLDVSKTLSELRVLVDDISYLNYGSLHVYIGKKLFYLLQIMNIKTQLNSPLRMILSTRKCLLAGRAEENQQERLPSIF